MKLPFFLLALVAFVSFAGAYTIINDTVVYENQYGKLTQTPYILHDFEGNVVINATSYFNTTQALDFALGFVKADVKPSQAWKWELNASHNVSAFCNVSYSLTCAGAFNYTTNPKYAWCFASNGTIKWEHYFLNGWVGNKTIEWFNWEPKCSTLEYFDDWTKLNDFSKIEYNDKTWYVVTASFNANESKALKVHLIVKPATAGKYDMLIKRASDTWLQAFANGKYVLLDPWYDANWTLRKPLNLSETQGVDRYQEPFLVNVTGLKLGTSNCTKELRVTANYSTETPIPFAVIDANGQTAALGSQYCTIQFLVNMSSAANSTYTAKNSTNYFVYYSNGAATDPGYSASLPGWSLQFYGNDSFSNYGYTTSALSSNYSYTLNENQVWNGNDTNAAVGGYAYLTGVGAGSTWTVETRYKHVLNLSTGYGVFGYIPVVGTSSIFYLFISDSNVMVGSYTGGTAVYNSKTMVTTDKFHVYRLVTNDATNAYSLYVDDVLATSGTNGTETGASDQIWTSEYYNALTDKWNGEFDYTYFAKNGWFPPFNAVLGAEELSPAANVTINITAYDELTLAPIYFTTRILNSSGSEINYGSALTIEDSVLNLPAGNLTINVDNASGFYGRSYLRTNDFNTSLNLKAYLLNSTNSIIVRFHVKTSFTSPLPNSTVEIQKNLGGLIQTIGSKETDFNGDALFYLELNDPYFLLISHYGYTPFFQQLTPTQNDYTIYLYPLGGNGTLPAFPVQVTDDVYWFLSPFSNVIANETANITFFVNATNNNLTYFWLNVSNATDTLFFSNVTNSTSGGFIYYFLNWTLINPNTNVTVSAGFSHSPDSFILRTYFKGWFDVFIKTLDKIRDDFGASGLSKYGLAIVFLLIALLISAWVARVNLMGALIVALIILGFGASTGAFDFALKLGSDTDLGFISGFIVIAFTFITVVSLLFLRERI